MARQATRQKVFVGLSGGVDSSVSAALLKRDGYDVTGVFIRVWHEDTEPTQIGEHGSGTEASLWDELNMAGCTAAEDRLDAMRVCAKLGIPFRELDLEKEYKQEVVDYMIAEYKAGKTPNPDVMCNRFIKFGAFYKLARAEGADFIATGHYARVGTREIPNHKLQITNKSKPSKPKLKARHYMLCAGLDQNKDQSYFLWQIRKEQLQHVLFPVGGLQKSEVRNLAKKFGLITADKKDSQGLCFVGRVDMKEFLSHYIASKKGKIFDENGRTLGVHDGVALYTLGERVGIPGDPDGKPYYVISKNIRANTITVSHKSPEGELGGTVREVRVKNWNWISGSPVRGRRYSVRMRYRQPLEDCTVQGAKVIFARPQASVTPGQSLVLYDGDVLLGGGIIL